MLRYWLSINQRFMFLVAACLFWVSIVNAVTYTFPAGTPPTAVAPQTLANGDTLNVNSGTLRTTNSTNYTVNLLQNATINVQSGATISYAGTNSSGGTIFYDQANDASPTINIYGTVSAGTSDNAFRFNNSNSSNTGTYQVNVYDGTINGNFVSTGVQTVILCVTGNASINGNISMTPYPPTTVGYSQFQVGNDIVVTYPNSSFVSQGEFTGYVITVYPQSTLTVNHVYSLIQFTIADHSIAYVNNTLISPISLVDSTSTIVLNADVDMSAKGSFVNSLFTAGDAKALRTVNITQNAASGTFSISNNYTSVMTDALNYGRLNVSGATEPTTTDMNNVVVEYGGGYFPSGTYTIYNNTLPFDVTPTAYPFIALEVRFSTRLIAKFSNRND